MRDIDGGAVGDGRRHCRPGRGGISCTTRQVRNQTRQFPGDGIQRLRRRPRIDAFAIVALLLQAAERLRKRHERRDLRPSPVVELKHLPIVGHAIPQHDVVDLPLMIQVRDVQRGQPLLPVGMEPAEPFVARWRVLHLVAPQDRGAILEVSRHRDAQIAFTARKRDERRQRRRIVRPGPVGEPPVALRRQRTRKCDEQRAGAGGERQPRSMRW
jgi:hypothetical protein